MSLKGKIRAMTPIPALSSYHRLRGILAAALAGFPGRKLQVFGITGTNGKTSTSLFLYSILTTARRKTGLATTVRFSDGSKLVVNKEKMTTLTPFRLQRMLRSMVRAEATMAVLEVTSHALAQHRVSGVSFDTVVFTNFSREHIGEGIYHRSVAEYRQMKERLFAKPHRVSVVNLDDPVAKYFLKYPATRIIRYGLNPEAEVNASNLMPTDRGIQFTLTIGKEDRPVQLSLPGEFNVYNALAAAAAAFGTNIGIDTIVEGLEALAVIPGRLELLPTEMPFQVVIDYAHSPDALKRTFEAIKPRIKGRLIHVGGATGNRDKSKRELLGALAAQYADVIFITDEDPDNEDPGTIIKAVAAGVKRGAGTKKKLIEGKNYFEILDRTKAIQMALDLAQKGDLVLITGKGDETSMIIKGKLVPYSDREVVTKYLKGKK